MADNIEASKMNFGLTPKKKVPPPPSRPKTPPGSRPKTPPGSRPKTPPGSGGGGPFGGPPPPGGSPGYRRLSAGQEGHVPIDRMLAAEKEIIGFGPKFYHFLWNKKTKEVLGRTWYSWLKIFVFYLIFYAALTAYFILFLYIFYLTMRSGADGPVLGFHDGGGLIGNIPGIGARPQPIDPESNLISISLSDPDIYDPATYPRYKELDEDGKNDIKMRRAYVEKSQAFLVDQFDKKPKEDKDEPGKFEPPGVLEAIRLNNVKFKSKLKKCGPGVWPDKKMACEFDLSDQFGPCGEKGKGDYGYKKGTPCVMIKLNKIFGWMPKFYDENIPYLNGKDKEKKKAIKNFKDVFGSNSFNFEKYFKRIGVTSQEMKQLIKKTFKDKIGTATGADELTIKKALMRTVWIYCYGESAHDRENVGPITYYPIPGIEGYYFPYLMQDAYISPFLMLRFSKPLKNVQIAVKCSAYFDEHAETRRLVNEGTVHFDLYVEQEVIPANAIPI